MKSKSRAPFAYIVILSIIALFMAGSVVLAKAAPQERQAFQSTANSQQPIASNYCLSCHTTGDPRLENPTAWRGGMAIVGKTACPAVQKINEELYYTERLLLAIDRHKSTLPSYTNTASLDSRLASAQQSYLRLLDAPVTSLEAFTAEAQQVRFKLGKVYSGVKALDEAAKQTHAMVAGIAVTLVLLGSLVWGLYNTRHVSKTSSRRRRSTVLGVAVFLLLIFAFFALPLLRVPAE